MLDFLNYKLNTKSGRKFVEEIVAHPKVKDEIKEALKELQSKQKPLKKRSKSSQSVK